MKGTKRSLQTICPVFSTTVSSNADANNLNNWTGTDPDTGNSITLGTYCLDNNCCSGTDACSNWNTSSTYEICPNSCDGIRSCRAIARDSSSATVKVGSDACKGYHACITIARDSSSATVEVQMNACDGDNACSNIALKGTGSATVEVQMNACKGLHACRAIARDSLSATVEIQMNACDGVVACQDICKFSTYVANVLVETSECVGTSECENCGRDSDFTGIFDTNQSCCDVVTGEDAFLDSACHESMMPSGKKHTETSKHN